MSPSPKAGTAVRWRPLVICPHAAVGGRLAAALQEAGAAPAETLNEYPRMGALSALAAARGANICFLDAATNPEHAQVLIAEIAASIPVVVLLARNDADLILRCLRRGACEFVNELTAESVRAVLDRLQQVQTPEPHAHPGTVWCVVPGKPGCGASTLAVHLAIQAKARGKVLLVDTDALAASAAFQLKLKPGFHLGDVLRDWKRMDQDLWARFTIAACGIDILAAPEDPGTRCEVGRQTAGELSVFWRERYQTVVIDVADARAAVDSGFAALADTVLLVTTNELAALQTTRRALQCLEQGAQCRGRLRLLLNRYTPATGLKREDVQKALAIEPFAAVSNDYETIQAALLEGHPAAEASRFGASVKALCQQLQDGGATVPKKSVSWLGSLLSRH